jgi:DNA-binding transcriptional MerR regulator
VADDELVPIGQFARLSGLSIHALRHYDDVGLLAPAEVDSVSGYRRYRRDQVRTARLIRALRCVDLPVDEIRRLIAAPEQSQDLLTRHRHRLERQRSLLADRLRDVDRFLEEGLTMPELPAGCRPVQIKIAVDDAQQAIAFYQQAFGLRYDVTRRTDDGDYSSFMFGEYGGDFFFLLHLIDDPGEVDRPGPSTFGLTVEDVDACHARAIAAGGAEVVPLRDPQGMPRCSAVKDPSGNWIWLYQA